MVSHVTSGLTIQARYHLTGASTDPPPPDSPFDLALMLRQLGLLDRAAIEALRRATATVPEFDTLLAGIDRPARATHPGPGALSRDRGVVVS